MAVPVTPTGALLSYDTIRAVHLEAIRAHQKHGDMSILNPGISDGVKLAALVEEVGEVAKELTYDTHNGREALLKELIQVANVALSWYESETQQTWTMEHGQHTALPEEMPIGGYHDTKDYT